MNKKYNNSQTRTRSMKILTVGDIYDWVKSQKSKFQV